ncbi:MULTISPECIES: HAMP domain-containing methyl-accepting chemotaxis protein [unclassified Rhizobium]|uniref:HAMP domain-containing methyl-accepting chemotaxis protein n=1 Tax=unclassified Rhizobium TaxID=2613769 RepID=UPI001A98474C|nr:MULTISPECIES: HAMP domain-containing methyl-accepting chemotaxis protein [unclassified Rhizobium]MBX5160662.1 methyl-accepting chemotaxis protein [Rhizobium sp. NZLR8]MBX5173115.1 methyl-accepting chemotaxis protein [Rhizobium sp. NZLR1b]MBX5186217.1 methyl-accepting chemotaxis protein [Rhizobium sp. NZLR5]MBX5191883.1 methyl-accepting chemotaxis protein [Rhizobium sp. NZLR3b]MBX5204657.1 methyl-accepting chemotaxis protein [Rhizobium sp. NZLR1]
MKRPSIKQALIVKLSIISLFMVGLSYVSLSTISTLRANTEQIGTFWMQRLVTAREIKDNFLELKLVYAQYLLEDTAEEQTVARQKIDAAGAAVEKVVTEYEKGVRTERGRELINQLKPEVSKYRELAEQMIALENSGKEPDAVRFFKENMEPQSELVDKAVGDLVAFILNQAEGFVAASDGSATSAFMLTSAIAALAVLIAMAGMVFAIFGIANPIRSIASAMRRLSDGDLDSDIPGAGRADEVGEMAGAVEVFRQNALNVVRLETEAAASRSESEAVRAAAQQRAEREAEQLRFATTTLGGGLRRLAAGDISFQLSEQFASEYESLREDFNASLRQLGATIGAVLQTVHSIDNGTGEIASAAQDLSKRTEQQAASLEETAAALDEITSNVSMASKRTDEARNVALEADISAQRSAAVVSEAEQAMRRIEDSSEQISNIIGAIDEIAFQTNLLALNAGVEAARAGEAGKGFAVVAQEVRELAQRAAQAAKEIKGFIQKSSTDVKNGVKLVLETGTSLKSIGEYVVQINQLMDAIATSAREQSTGLAEINTAVNHMDQATQQNAAMVEQSTAAAASLSSEAGRLRDLVSQFQLDGDKNAAGVERSSRAFEGNMPIRLVTPRRVTQR